MTAESPTAQTDRFSRRLFSPLGQALLLGGTGFVAGYLLPLLRMPEANQGPLLGIFITGPVGFVCGLALGVVGRFLDLRKQTAAILLAASCAALASITYVVCKPEDIQLARLVDGTVL